MTATNPRPVVLLGDPDRRSVIHLVRMADLAREAIADQRAPIVLHPHFMPWLYEERTVSRDRLAPYASAVAAGILTPFAQRTDAELWIVAPDPSALPPWAEGTVRHWLRTRHLRTRDQGGANVRMFPFKPAEEVRVGAV